MRIYALVTAPPVDLVGLIHDGVQADTDWLDYELKTDSEANWLCAITQTRNGQILTKHNNYTLNNWNSFELITPNYNWLINIHITSTQHFVLLGKKYMLWRPSPTFNSRLSLSRDIKSFVSSRSCDAWVFSQMSVCCLTTDVSVLTGWFGVLGRPSVFCACVCMEEKGPCVMGWESGGVTVPQRETKGALGDRRGPLRPLNWHVRARGLSGRKYF